MRYLFIVQGEGRGHLTQAMSMEKLLLSRGHEVVGMLVGKSPSRILPSFFTSGVKAPVKYFETINFATAAQGKKPDALKTILLNVSLSSKFLPSVGMIRREIKESKADVVVNFYELLGSVGYNAAHVKAPMVCIGHQFLFLHEYFDFPEFGYEGHLALNFFSKSIAFGASKLLALSFRPMVSDPDHKIVVVPPILRPEVLAAKGNVSDGDFILGYMLNAGFADEVREWHTAHPDVPLHFFWDNLEAGPVMRVDDNLLFYYLDDKEFISQMAGCRAYASTGGFESICEAMYYGKPLLMVPSHIEQKCNAYDATRYDAAVSAEKFDLSVLTDFAENHFKRDEHFQGWVDSASEIFLRELEAK